MTISKISYFYAIPVVLLSALVLTGCTKSSGEVGQVVESLTIEQSVEELNTARLEKNPDAVWEFVHPDDKERWASSEEYKTEWNRLHADDPEADIVESVKEVIDVPAYTNPISEKEYTDVKKVVILRSSPSDPEATYDDYTQHYQNVDGRWYFFTKYLSSIDRQKTKDAAEEGPSFRALNKSPDKYIGERVKYTGQVIQIQEEADGRGYIRLSITEDDYGGWSYDDLIYVTYSQSTEALEEDVVTVYGVIDGAYTYVSQANYNITLPWLGAVAIERQ